MVGENDKRNVIHSKDDKFDMYVNVLLFMIENKGQTFMKMDIKQHLFGDDKSDSVKVMLSRCIDFYIESGIFIKITKIIDNDGKTIKLKPNQSKFRLYDVEIDGLMTEDKNGKLIEDTDCNINLHIPKSKEGRIKLSQTIASMILSIPNAVIYTKVIKDVMESQIFGFKTDFVSQTIGKVIVKHHNIQNMCNKTIGYPLDVIMSIINSQINVNVKFENFGNIIQLNNTKIKRITIKENGFDIHFNNFISQNQLDIGQILSIENSSEDGLRNDIEKIKEMINELPSDDKDKINKLIREVTPSMDLFEF